MSQGCGTPQPNSSTPPGRRAPAHFSATSISVSLNALSTTLGQTYDCNCRAIAFLSILPTGVVGSAAIAASTSGRACVATPRWSR